MCLTHRRCGVAVFILALLTNVGAWSAESRKECERDFAPQSGQSGKDVIWVPTRDELVMAMLKAAQVTAKDFVIDLGSGDGRIPIAAAKHFGAKALGIEYNPQMVQLAQCYVRAEGLTDKVEMRQADIFETDFSDATVLTLYLLSDLNMKLRPTILKMKPGTRVVSNSFEMGDWPPDEEIEVTNGFSPRGYLWIVPAPVQGTWSFREQGGKHHFQLEIEQTFQNIEVSVAGEPPQASVSEATLRGPQLAFTLAGPDGKPLTFEGTVDEDAIDAATRRGGATVKYVGKRVR